MLNTVNAPELRFLRQSTQLYAANAQVASFGTKRSWVRIPPPRLVLS